MLFTNYQFASQPFPIDKTVRSTKLELGQINNTHWGFEKNPEYYILAYICALLNTITTLLTKQYRKLKWYEEINSL